MRVLKTELESAIALSSKIQVLNGLLRNASQEIQTLKQGMKDAAALQSQTQMLERSLQEARTEIQTLRKDLGNTKTLRTTIQEQQRSLESFRTALASQEQLQRNQSKCREGAGEGRVSCPFGLLLISTCIPGEGVWVLERC